MKKVFYYCADVNPNRSTSLGIYKTSKEILRQLVNKKQLEINLILTHENKSLFSEFNCKKTIIPKNNHSYIFNKLFIHPKYANTLAEKGDAIFLPKGHLPIIRKKKIKYASFIHDMIPIYYLKKGKIKYIISSILLIISAKYSDLIFTNSNFSKKEIGKFTSKRIIPVPLGTKAVNPQSPAMKKNSYIFVIGNTNPHKNLELSKEIIKEYNSIKGLDYKIFYSKGDLTEEQLAGYYKDAKFSIFLSSIEGFGLPFIESYNYGTPVVFNNKTSLMELGRGIPGACNIEDRKYIFRAIDKVITMNKKEILKIRSKLLKKYNWKNCGDKIVRELLR